MRAVHLARKERLWHSGYDSSELEVASTRTLRARRLFAEAWAAVEERRRQAEAREAARKEAAEKRELGREERRRIEAELLLFSVRNVQHAVCDYYNVTRWDLLSLRRSGRLLRPRAVAMYLAMEMTRRKAWKHVGRLFDRDHSTIFHAHAKIGRDILVNPELAREIRTIRQTLEGNGS